jgi:hypothetical protein
VSVVVKLGEMDPDVHHAADDHQQETEDHRERQSSDPFYHKHLLQIHPRRRPVKSIGHIGMC